MREYKTNHFKPGDQIYLTTCCEGDYTYWGDVMVCKTCEKGNPRLRSFVCVPLDREDQEIS